MAPCSLLFVYPAVYISMNNMGVRRDARQNALDISRCIEVRHFDILKLSIPNPDPNAEDLVVAIIYSQKNGSQHGATGAYTYDRVTS